MLSCRTISTIVTATDLTFFLPKQGDNNLADDTELVSSVPFVLTYQQKLNSVYTSMQRARIT